MKPVIYIDTLFLLNFFMDTAVLLITAKILKGELPLLRIFAGALVGAAYSAAMFFPSLELIYMWVFKAAVLFGIFFLVFGGGGFFETMRKFAVFILVNAALCGTVLALVFMTDFGTKTNAALTGAGFYIETSPILLLIAISGTYGFLAVHKKMCKKKLYIESLKSRAVISYKGKIAETEVFADTGCLVCDPISDKPVVIADFNSVRRILDENQIKSVLEEDKDIAAAYLKGLRVLGFSSLGGDNFIYAISSDYVKIGERKIENVTVGISQGQNFSCGCGGIYNPELLTEGEVVLR